MSTGGQGPRWPGEDRAAPFTLRAGEARRAIRAACSRVGRPSPRLVRRALEFGVPCTGSTGHCLSGSRPQVPCPDYAGGTAGGRRWRDDPSRTQGSNPSRIGVGPTGSESDQTRIRGGSRPGSEAIPLAWRSATLLFHHGALPTQVAGPAAQPGAPGGRRQCVIRCAVTAAVLLPCARADQTAKFESFRPGFFLARG